MTGILEGIGKPADQVISLEVEQNTAEKFSPAVLEEGVRNEAESRISEELEMQALEPEIRTDVPNCEVAFVTGGPHEAAPKMNFSQGNNKFNAKGNCGLVSISNTLNRGGIVISEDDVTGRAISKGLCRYHENGNPAGNGGTNLEDRKKMFHELGFDSEIGRPNGGRGDLEDIAHAIDSNHGVVISVSADLLWDTDTGTPMILGKYQSNHCVTVTGIARDASTGQISGVYIADSGRGIPEDACRYLSVEEFHEVYTDVFGSGANITKKPIMGVQT